MDNSRKKAVLEMFSKARIAFQKEIITHHPDIRMKIALATAEVGEVEEGIAIGVVAAEFNIILDGIYSREQIEHMYDILINKLREKRQLVVNASENAKLVVPAPTFTNEEVEVDEKDIIH